MTSRPTTHDQFTREIHTSLKWLALLPASLLLVGWAVWFAPFDDLLDRAGTPLGADFAMFFVAGDVYARQPAALYDQAAHHQRRCELFPHVAANSVLPYRYPPVVAMLMSPLSHLNYVAAYVLFAAVMTAAWLLALRLLLDDLPVFAARPACAGEVPPVSAEVPPGARNPWRLAVRYGAIGWPLAWETLMGGQASPLALLIAASTIWLLQRRRSVLAGAVLACGLYKPNVLAIFAIGCVVKQPRVLWGAIPSAMLILAACWCAAGGDTLQEYVNLAASLTTSSWSLETPAWKTHHLAAAVSSLLPHARTYCVLTGTFLAVAVSLRRAAEQRDAHDRRNWALLILLNAVFNPYTPIYDLLLLVIPGLMMANEFLTRRAAVLPTGVAQPDDNQADCRRAKYFLAFLFLAPHVSQVLAQQTGVQLLPWLLLPWAYWLTRATPLFEARRAADRFNSPAGAPLALSPFSSPTPCSPGPRL